MAYRAEIEIGVKGVKQLNNFQAQLERLSNEVDRVNKKKFTVANLSSYSEALRKANETLSQTEIETNKAGKAAGLYKKNLDSFVTALLASKDAQELNNKLVQDEIQKRGAATQALKAYNAELAAPTKRGTQTTMSGAYLRGQPSLTPALPPDFNAVAAAGRVRASSLAKTSIQAGKAAQANAISERKTEEIRQNLAGARLNLEGMVAANKNMLPILQQAVELAEKQLRISKQGALVAGKFSPIQGNASTPGSPLFLKAQRERRNRLAEDLKLGAGFPLLFGGGAGAVGGGVLGALAGGGKGGFGSQILFSAIGQQFDAAMQRLNSLAATLGETGNIFEGLEQAGFKVSGSLKNVVNDLEKAGNASLAYAIQLQELEKVYGKRGATDLANLERGNQRLADSFKRLNAVLFAPLIPLATAISNITSGAITQLSRLFEFIAGDPASRAATPDFRFEGEFAQASGIDRQIFERSGRSREAQKKAVEEQRKLLDSFNSASKAQARVNDQRRQGAQQIKKIELDINGLAVERAQIEADSLRYQLQVQSQIRNLILTKQINSLKAEQQFNSIVSEAAKIRLDVFRQTGATAEKITETFNLISDEDINKVEQFRARLNDIFTISDAATRLELFGEDGEKVIAQTINNYEQLLKKIRELQQARFKTVPQKIQENAQNEVKLLTAQLKVEEAVTTEIKRQAELELLKLQLRQSSPKLEEQNPDLFAQIVELRQQLANPRPESNETIVKKRVDELQSEINEMTKLGNVAVKVADNIGAAFSTAFQDVINGSKSTQEALSDMFKTIGENFVAMAADIIAKQIQMIILQTILKALGAAVGGSSGSDVGFDTSTPLPGGMEFGHLASGGPAEANRPYMVGERGPELFVPSQSGGVMRNEDMRQMMGRSPAGASAPQMNFTFETTNIGGTEYVSREQLEQAMVTTRRQATNDGAKRGMSMTLDKMQNSPRTRSRVGIR